MHRIHNVLGSMRTLAGLSAVALVDSETGLCVDSASWDSSIQLGAQAAIQSRVFRLSRGRTRLMSDGDLVVTSTTMVHVMRGLSTQPTLFLYVVFERDAYERESAHRRIAWAEAEVDRILVRISEQNAVLRRRLG